MRRFLRENAYAGLRVTLGVILLLYGIPRAAGGFEEWERIGQVMLMPFGIERFHIATGFLAAYCFCIGGAGLALGFLYYPAICLSFACLGGNLALVLRKIWFPPDKATAPLAVVEAVEKVEGSWQMLGLMLILLLYLGIKGPGDWAIDNLIVGHCPEEEDDEEDDDEDDDEEEDEDEEEEEEEDPPPRKRSGTKNGKQRKRSGPK